MCPRGVGGGTSFFPPVLSFISSRNTCHTHTQPFVNDWNYYYWTFEFSVCHSSIDRVTYKSTIEIRIRKIQIIPFERIPSSKRNQLSIICDNFGQLPGFNILVEIKERRSAKRQQSTASARWICPSVCIEQCTRLFLFPLRSIEPRYWRWSWAEAVRMYHHFYTYTFQY